MKKIGLLSDTHGFIDEDYFNFFNDVDEIWHAGDFGTLDCFEQLEIFKPLRAVYGNVDGESVRVRTIEKQRFTIEGVKVFMIHIGGYPGNYSKFVKPEIFNNPPKLFISGHSHILKVIYDKSLGLLHINPGAAGNSGFHKVKTIVRFEISEDKILNLEIFEKKRN
jgi:uncharacterized protein